MITESILTCPNCNNKQAELLHENISPINFRCENCTIKVQISFGKCCVYCEYGDASCLNAQISGSACCSGD